MVEERQRLHEKTCNSYLNSDATSEHAMSDHSKQLRPCLYVVQNYQFQFEIVFFLGKWNVIDILFVYLFLREKINQLQVKNKPINPTRKLQNKIFCSLRMRPILGKM